MLGALLLQKEKSDASLGAFLVEHGVLTEAAVQEALQLQQQLQVTMEQLLCRANAQPTVRAIA